MYNSQQHSTPCKQPDWASWNLVHQSSSSQPEQHTGNSWRDLERQTLRLTTDSLTWLVLGAAGVSTALQMCSPGAQRQPKAGVWKQRTREGGWERGRGIRRVSEEAGGPACEGQANGLHRSTRPPRNGEAVPGVSCLRRALQEHEFSGNSDSKARFRNKKRR